MKVHEAVVDALVKEGVDTVFGLLGGGIEHLVDRAVKRGIRFVSVRHEQAAVGAADGYSRATGRTGVAFLSYGPGLANAANPLVVARKAGSRVLVISSAVGDNERFTMHLFDQEPFLRATIGNVVTPRWPDSIHLDLREAMSQLAQGRGPVAVNLNQHLLSLDVPAGWDYRPIRDEWTEQRTEPDQQRVIALAEMLRTAERPLLLAGRGAVLSGARDAISALAERVGAALSTTLMAKGWFRGHPADLGVTGGFGDPDSQSLMRDADLVIAFGARISRYTAHWGTMFADTTLVRVDRRPDSTAEMNTVSLSLWADARSAAEALLALVPAGSRPPWIHSHTPTARPSGGDNKWAREFGLRRAPAVGDPIGGVDVRRAIEILNERLPARRTVVIDAGNHMGVPAAHFDVADPLSLICPWEFGAIGGGLAVALGAALGRPDQPVVAFLGDGCLMLGLADLDSLRRHRARVLLVLQDDGGFRSERNSYRARGLDPALADYDNPDLVAVANALGIAAYSAPDDSGFDAALKQMLATDPDLLSPALIRLEVDRLAPNVEMDRAFDAYRPY